MVSNMTTTPGITCEEIANFPRAATEDCFCCKATIGAPITLYPSVSQSDRVEPGRLLFVNARA